MFTNFTVTKQGLVESKPRSRPNALNGSCLPCRRKKKKCDVARPICERCRNSYGQDLCIWPDEQRKRRSLSREMTESCGLPGQPSPSSYSDSTSTSRELVKPTESFRSSARTASIYPMDLGFENFCAWSIPDAVTNISPDLSPQAFLSISAAFQNRILCLGTDFKDSIVVHSLPLALQHPPLLHAWVACSVIALSRSVPYWHEKAIRHYDSALSGLSQALQSQEKTSEKWKRETVILLHLFEGFQSKSEESPLGKAHLHGAHQLFNPTVKDKSPMSYHDVLVLEAYIMHTTNNYLFQPESGLAISHISEALDTFTSALKHLDLECNWRNSPWIGFTGPELTDIIYRTSWLTHKPSLDSEDLDEVEKIIAALSSWTAPPCQEESPSTNLDLPPERVVLLARAYWCACSYLATTLCHNENNPLPTETNDFVVETLSLIDRLAIHGHTINNHLWPLLVVGTAVSDSATQEHIASLLPHFSQVLGPEAVKRAERFLAVAWEVDGHGMIYGRRIFQDREALYQMFF